MSKFINALDAFHIRWRKAMEAREKTRKEELDLEIKIEDEKDQLIDDTSERVADELGYDDQDEEN